MAHKEKMLQITKRVRLFNCDNTYKLELVEKLLEESKKLLEDCGIHVELVGKHPFRLAQMSEMVNKIPTLKMDMAFFVVHAHESRLSINEDKAGIGYAKMYKALLKETGKERKYFYWVDLPSMRLFSVILSIIPINMWKMEFVMIEAHAFECLFITLYNNLEQGCTKVYEGNM